MAVLWRYQGIVAALLENHQTAEGILIPKALQAYTKFDIIN